MTFIQSIILGIVQGITEFLPISSSAHLVLVPHLLNWQIPEDQLFPFDVLVQIGTLVAVIVYYREDLAVIIRSMVKGISSRKPFEEVEARTGWLTLLASIPAAVVGFLLKTVVESAFGSPAVTAVFLFITAALLVASEVFDKKNKEIDSITWKDALWIGAFQLLSIFPGISRSGSTITGGMIRNLKRKTAGQFAFLMSIPIMLAAGIIGIVDLFKIPNLNHFLPIMVTGFIIAAVVGYFSIKWLINYINNHSLLPFAGYCLLLGAGSLLLNIYNTQPIVSSPSGSTSSSIESSAYRIGIDPDQEWLIPIMNNCLQDMPELNLVFEQHANSEEAAALFDAFFTYAQPQTVSQNTYKLGEEQLFIVVNPALAVRQITTEAINAIFTGRIASWQAFAEHCPECYPDGASGEAIDVWVMSEESGLWKQFDAAFLENPVSSFASIAPTAKAMRQSISSDPNSIGFLSSGWLDDSVKVLPFMENSDLTAPLSITVTTQGEPDEQLSLWLNCIQTAINP